MNEIKKEKRIVFKLPYNLSIYKVAVLPLMKKDGLKEKALQIFWYLQKYNLICDYDETGSIGKRYRKQDENGTKFCICIDYQTLQDETVTIRDRDNMEQKRLKITEILGFINSGF